MKLNTEHKTLLIKIGSLCKANRIMRGATLKDVAKEVNCTITEVSNFENGKSNNALLYFWYFGTDFD